MTLAQNADILLLDEPTTFLDLSHQIDLLKLVQSLQITRGQTVGMVLHDVNLAARFADHIVALRSGEVLCEGTPGDVITQETMAAIYGLDCTIISDPHTSQPHIIPK